MIIPDGFRYLKRHLDDFARLHPHLDRNVFVMIPFSGSRASPRPLLLTGTLDGTANPDVQAGQFAVGVTAVPFGVDG